MSKQERTELIDPNHPHNERLRQSLLFRLTDYLRYWCMKKENNSGGISDSNNNNNNNNNDGENENQMWFDIWTEHFWKYTDSMTIDDDDSNVDSAKKEAQMNVQHLVKHTFGLAVSTGQ